MNKLHLVILGIILCMIMSKYLKKNVENLNAVNILNNPEAIREGDIEAATATAAAETEEAKLTKLLELIDIDDENKELIINGNLIIKNSDGDETAKIQSAGHIKTTKDIIVFGAGAGNFAGGNQVVTLNDDGIEVKDAGVVDNTNINSTLNSRLDTIENKISSISNDGDTLKINKNIIHIGSDSEERPYVKISNEGPAGKIEMKSKDDKYTTLRGFKGQNNTTLIVPNNLQVGNKNGDPRLTIKNTDSDGNIIDETETDPGSNVQVNIMNKNITSQLNTLETDVDTLETDVDTLETNVDTINSTIAPISTTDNTVKINANTVEFGDAGKVVIKGNDNNSGKILLKSGGDNSEYSTIRGWNNNGDGIAIDGKLYLTNNFIGSNGNIQFTKGIDISQKLKLNNWELSGVDNKLNFNHNGETPMEFSAEADTEKQGIFIYKKQVDNL